MTKYWLGKKRSEETKKKISLTKKGKPNLGFTFPIGHIPWNKGKKFRAETLKKMSEARKRFYANGGKHPLLGKKRPDITGENNPNWGKVNCNHPKWKDVKKRPFYKSIRQLSQYVEWRKAVFERDKFTCVICETSGIYVEADHFPKRFIDIVRDNSIEEIGDAINCAELWNINNGRTLCQPCHRKTATWGRRKDCKA